VWDAETGKLLEQKRGDNSSVAFSPNGELLAVGSNQGMIVVYGVKKRLGDDAQKQETANPDAGNE
jgi:WD40 repeat protein